MWYYTWKEVAMVFNYFLSANYFWIVTLLSYYLAASPKAGASPQPTKLVKPMKTLVEEQHVRETKPLLNRADTDDVNSNL